LSQLHGTSYGATVEPAIGVDAKGFAGILLEFGGTMYGFEQRKKAYREVGLAIRQSGNGGNRRRDERTYDAHPGSLGKQGRAGA
jgi:hypothetical protein